jgi:hypothetical protein
MFAPAHPLLKSGTRKSANGCEVQNYQTEEGKKKGRQKRIITLTIGYSLRVGRIPCLINVTRQAVLKGLAVVEHA